MAKKSASQGKAASANPLKARAEAKRAVGAKKAAATASRGERRWVPLALAWGLTLALVGGGAIALHLTYTPPPETVSAPEGEGEGEGDGTAPDGKAATASAPPATADQTSREAAGTTARDTAGQDAQGTPSPDREAARDQTGTSAPAAPSAGTDGAEDPPANSGDGGGIPSFDTDPFPDPRYTDTGRFQGLPRVADDTSTPFQRYSRAGREPSQPAIALVLTNIGLNKSASQRALESLPPEVTLAISPYADSPQSWANRAHEGGHELLLMLPMEPQDYPRNDPGPDTLMVEASSAENIQSLHKVMRSFGGYMGLVNHMGSRFTANRQSLRPVLKEIGARGLLFLDARVSRYSAAGRMAREFGMPYAVNNRFLDSAASADAIDDKFADLESIARSNGVAVAIGRPLPVTVERIQYWRGRLAANGVILVPLSAVSGLQEVGS